jgi:hypothetical protein
MRWLSRERSGSRCRLARLGGTQSPVAHRRPREEPDNLVGDSLAV